MSATLQLATVWAGEGRTSWPDSQSRKPVRSIVVEEPEEQKEAEEKGNPLAFYRRHTESLLKRYFYAAMQVGRTPSILGEPIARGWASCHAIRTFEDAVIFVLDVERCLDRLSALERQVLSRVILQDYSLAEAASLLGMSCRAMHYKFPRAVDQLTQLLLNAGLLSLPH